MIIIELRENTFPRAISEVARVLRSGGVVISPTDTVYGILGDAANESAVSKMFNIKNRSAQKAFPVFVADIATARRYAYISDAKAKFLEQIWPGPVTAIFHHKERLSKALTGGLDTIGMRMPENPFLAELLKRIDIPIAQTSANISNEPPAQNIEQIKDYFKKSHLSPDLVIDAGELAGQPSTVVDCTGAAPIILRTGMITKAELDKLFSGMVG
ncbi:MAG: threonylcarbamoyl-AMP synthase [Candidatus Sungbacteria bacterium]|nr:threonylcarbamoyl-AMP synthase [Candidatus Sungbacteria bacterium]